LFRKQVQRSSLQARTFTTPFFFFCDRRNSVKSHAPFACSLSLTPFPSFLSVTCATARDFFFFAKSTFSIDCGSVVIGHGNLPLEPELELSSPPEVASGSAGQCFPDGHAARREELIDLWIRAPLSLFLKKVFLTNLRSSRSFWWCLSGLLAAPTILFFSPPRVEDTLSLDKHRVFFLPSASDYTQCLG